MPKQESSLNIVTPNEVFVQSYLIVEELDRALDKFPSFPVDPIHMVAVMAEESGEAVQASLQYVYDDLPKEELEKELIQTAAMCIRCLAHLACR